MSSKRATIAFCIAMAKRPYLSPSDKQRVVAFIADFLTEEDRIFEEERFRSAMAKAGFSHSMQDSESFRFILNAFETMVIMRNQALLCLGEGRCGAYKEGKS